MTTKKYILVFWLALVLPVQAQEINLSAPAQASVGATIVVNWEGGTNPREFISIVPPGTRDGTYAAYQYEYANKNPVTLTAPAYPGEYEIRYLVAASPDRMLAMQTITVADSQATLTAPLAVAAGAGFNVQWTGPNNVQDVISLVEVGAAEGTYEWYKYTNTGSPVSLAAPDQAGEYELRYMMGLSPLRTLGRAPVTVTGVGASISMAATVAIPMTT